jgi:hypothetical protein
MKRGVVCQEKSTTRYRSIFHICLRVKKAKSFNREVETIERRYFPLKSKQWISCQYLYLAQIEDIWLKSALERKRGCLLTSGSYIALKTPWIPLK